MGKLTGGIDYDMIGRTGNHVGRRVRGENIISMRPTKSNKPPSVLQLNQQLKFGLVTHVLSEMSEFIKIGFQDFDARMSPMNAAVSYNLEKAVTGMSPNYVLDYPQVLFSKGKLDGANAFAMASTEAAQLDFSWLANTGDFTGSSTDKVVVIVYNPVKDKYAYSNGAVTRAALSYDMALPATFSDDTVQVYTAFVSADGKEVSTTEYVGSMMII